MKSFRTQKFKALYEKLQRQHRNLADKSYALWQDDPFHPSLNFEKVDEEENLWSARVSQKYRAICKKDRDETGETCYVWFWIGEHDEYLRLING